jgi:hypothetical protein
MRRSAVVLVFLVLPAFVGGCNDDPSDCGVTECFRAVECVEECGGPVVQSGCCPCPEGTIDSIDCGSGGKGPREPCADTSECAEGYRCGGDGVCCGCPSATMECYECPGSGGGPDSGA